MKVAFIGLGIMGSRMAANLLKNGVDLTVWNRTSSITEPLRDQGAKVALTLDEAVANKDIVFSMLSTPQVLNQLAFGEHGFVKSMKPDALWVDCTTVNPSFSEKSSENAKAMGIRMLEAPVAGTKPHAQNAELTFFVGGLNSDLNEVKPLLEMMGKKVLHVGEAGKASALKVLVNSLLGQSMLIFAETVILGEKMGLEKEFLLNLLPNLVVSAPFTKAKAEMIRKDDYEVQFPLELMQKDMELVAESAYEQVQPLYMANIAKEVYAHARKKGLGRLDFSAIYRFLDVGEK